MRLGFKLETFFAEFLNFFLFCIFGCLNCRRKHNLLILYVFSHHIPVRLAASASKAQPQRLQHASWLGDTHKMLIIFRNDIYVRQSPWDDVDFQLTFNGEPDVIFNGIPDWLYQGVCDYPHCNSITMRTHLHNLLWRLLIPSFSSFQQNFPIFYFSTIHVRENFFLFCDDGFLKICFSPRSLLLLWWLSETQWVEIDGTWKLFFGALPGVKKSLSCFYCSFDGGRCVLMWLFLLWCRGSDAETHGDVALTGRHASYVRVLQW